MCLKPLTYTNLPIDVIVENFSIYFFLVGVAHGDDTMYILKTAYGSPHVDVKDAKLIPVMVNIWLSFVKTGYVNAIFYLNIRNYEKIDYK